MIRSGKNHQITVRKSKQKKPSPGDGTRNRYSLAHSRNREPLIYTLKKPIKTLNWKSYYIHRIFKVKKREGKNIKVK